MRKNRTNLVASETVTLRREPVKPARPVRGSDAVSAMTAVSPGRTTLTTPETSFETLKRGG